MDRKPVIEVQELCRRLDRLHLSDMLKARDDLANQPNVDPVADAQLLGFIQGLQWVTSPLTVPVYVTRYLASRPVPPVDQVL